LAADLERRRLDGKVALITGATSGIGRATALGLARLGVRVVVAGRDRERGDAVVHDIAGSGGEAVFVQGDVTRAPDIGRMVDAALERFGRLDIAFNNAGYQEPRQLLAEQPPEVYDAVFDGNVRSVFLAMQAEIRAMLMQGGGVIINNASVSGVRNPYPGLSLYCASKAAVISMTRSAALEYAASGIRINAVSPGRVITPMMLGSKVADMEAVAAGLPIKRMGQPEEVAAAVVWLASEEASFVVGHNLAVDGGFLSQ
jgi:NAD(P)-dependent dehydrogenase (short-subunit alcohol dehydrogenase family)